MESAGIIEKKLSEWGSPVCIVAKADGSPRFCVDCSTTINKFLVRETWPMPDIESHIDTVGGANFITACDVQSASWQIPIAKKDRHKTAFVTSKGKNVFKVLHFGIANAPWIIPTCHVPCVRQLWPTEWLVGIHGRCHRVFCDVGSSPQIIIGYVSRTSNSRPDIEAIQNSLRTKESSVPRACLGR